MASPIFKNACLSYSYSTNFLLHCTGSDHHHNHVYMENESGHMHMVAHAQEAMLLHYSATSECSLGLGRRKDRVSQSLLQHGTALQVFNIWSHWLPSTSAGTR